MLVYGDDQREVLVGETLARIRLGAARLGSCEPGLSRHQASVELFVELASLLQGIADWQCELQGYDEVSALQDRLMAALRLFANAIDHSWRSGFEDQIAVDLSACLRHDGLSLPATVTVKRCEGYAFYGVYPETYLDAGRDLPPGSVVVGLRSIGTSLAALVAAASKAETVLTLRPSGHPFSRSVSIGPKLEQQIRARNQQHFIIVDEGPGMSGSSFGGVADWLESVGVARERIIFMPSHPGDLGPEARPEHRQRWAEADKRVLSFEQLFVSPLAPTRLPEWFHDITGDLAQAPADLSAGNWAGERATLPTAPAREARKFLLEGTNGKFILKYAGLDMAARAKFDRAQELYRAGFCAEPLAMRYGFMIHRYVEGEPTKNVPSATVLDYCRFRRDRFPAAHQGASLRDLLAMAEHNIRQAEPEVALDLSGRWSTAALEKLQAEVRPVHIDGRMHWWEWLRTCQGIIKTDAVDHSGGHDLVGCQDILWDVAGASVELDHSASRERELLSALEGSAPLRRELLKLLKLCYVGFQLGWWSLSSTAQGWARAQWYRGKIPALIAA